MHVKGKMFNNNKKVVTMKIKNNSITVSSNKAINQMRILIISRNNSMMIMKMKVMNSKMTIIEFSHIKNI